MATVDKNFKVKNGLVVEGTTATVNGEDILTTASTTTDLTEGTNLYFTEQRAVDAVTDEIDTAVTTAIDDLDTDAIEEGATNLYFTNQRAIDAVGGSATDANTPDTVVKRDASGNFAANDVTVNEISFGEIGRIYEDSEDLYIVSGADGDDVIIEADDIRLNAVDDIFLTAGSTSDVYVRGPGNIYLVGPAIFAADNEEGLNADKVATQGYVDNAITNIDLTFNSDEITEGTTNLYYTDARVDSHLSGTHPIEYNAGAISLDIDATGGIQNDEGGIRINRTTVDGWYDASGAAATAETNANTYTDTALEDYTPTSSLDTTVGGYGYIKTADLSGYATESYVGTAIDNLVDGAPGLLDTLNEIAAAINDDANYATTMTTALAGKQNSLTAGTNIDITEDTISVTGLDTDDVSEGTNLYFTNQRALDATSSAYDVAGAAAAAQTAAESYADGLASNYEPAGSAQSAVDALDTDDIEEGSTNLYFTNQRALDATASAYDATGTAQGIVDALTTDDIEEGTSLYFTDVRAVDALEAVVPNFTAVEVNSLAKQVAATVSSLGSVPVAVYSFAKADYRTAKFLVKIDNGTDTEVTEVLLTLDSSDNIAITEYAIVGTNGTRGEITADISGSNVRLMVDPVNDSTIYAVGTLLA